MIMLAKFAKDESGAIAVECGLIVAGISLAIMAVLNAFDTQLVETFCEHLDPACCGGRQQVIP
jgi:pilus assembly protein Flp/PilA